MIQIDISVKKLGTSLWFRQGNCKKYLGVAGVWL